MINGKEYLKRDSNYSYDEVHELVMYAVYFIKIKYKIMKLHNPRMADDLKKVYLQVLRKYYPMIKKGVKL